MLKMFKFQLLCIISIFVTCLMIMPVNASTKSNLLNKYKNESDEEIRKTIYMDLNMDGKEELVVITSVSVDQYKLYASPSAWYVSDTKCYKFYDSSHEEVDTSDGLIEIYKVKNANMLRIVAVAGVNSPTAYAWTFDKNGAKEVKNTGRDMNYLGNNEFEILDDGFTYGGHSHVHYYSKWDGEKLVEYGGLEISEMQLRLAKNSNKILLKASELGQIQNIIYRDNGLIFINYTKPDSEVHLALTLKNGALKYYGIYRHGKNDFNSATDIGIVQKNFTTCVKYPKKFPLSSKQSGKIKDGVYMAALGEASTFKLSKNKFTVKLSGGISFDRMNRVDVFTTSAESTKISTISLKADKDVFFVERDTSGGAKKSSYSVIKQWYTGEKEAYRENKEEFYGGSPTHFGVVVSGGKVVEVYTVVS